MPAYGNHILDKGYNVSAAVSKFRAVKLHATLEDTVSPVSGVADDVFGVAQYEVTTAELAKKKRTRVRSRGITEMEAGAAIPAHQDVGVDTAGRCIILVTGSRCVGKSLQIASGIGVRIAVDLDAGGWIK